ncbi:AAA family ATPase [Symmachiella dynata]|uniref:Septum site-determining protein MinD n=1 Tax=Symmachiella dynata TaxID=2527995 RepID=A0A517ZNY6_9PLAN|nr:response regulator [Symmachiella dynata]QDT48540.1 Septum site-determining protein MinD [Symmachiella dynata]QDU44130.1 Septum site-determining protein MinD [Symmachiella dynata]
MNNVVRLAIVDPNDSSRTTIKNLLMGMDMVWLEAECSRYDFFADVISQTQPDIALINLDDDEEKGLALISRVTQDLPGCSVLVVSSSTEGSLILHAMRNGAKEFLSYPLKWEDFLAALDRIQNAGRGRGGDGSALSCQVVAVGGAGGGVGCTSLAVNLGCSLAKEERNSVAIVDIDFALGDADVWLDIIPDYTIHDVTENITRLDYSLLKRSLTQHDCGVYLLPRPVQITNDTTVDTDQLKRMIALLKATFTHLVIDVSKTYSPLDMATLELADSVLMVTQLDLPCLRNVVRLMQYFDNIDGLVDKTKVVVNRLGLEEEQISLNKALETIGREIFWQIPNDYATMVEARNNGIPLQMQAPRAKLTKCVDQLAAALDGKNAAETTDDGKKPRRTSLFGFLSSGSK